MSTFVLPDMHGNRGLALDLLRQEGLIEGTPGVPVRLRPDVTIVQLGDLCNCVLGSINQDLYALKMVELGLIDFMLVGNHEHPYFGGPPFDGFGFFHELKNELMKLDDRGKLRAAHEVDGILLTHAGVTADADIIDQWEGDNRAKEFANGLNYLWATDKRHAMFSAIGVERGGMSFLGGVLWSDWDEPKTKLFPQIFGHTVGDDWRAHYAEPGFVMSHNGTDPALAQTLCIDVGVGKKARRILGAWIRDGKVEIVDYQHKEQK